MAPIAGTRGDLYNNCVSLSGSKLGCVSCWEEVRGFVTGVALFFRHPVISDFLLYLC